MIALAVPINDGAGHPAGFELNCAAVHAFCNVVNREGSCFGRSTLTCLMFASWPQRARGVGQLHVQARTGGFAGLAHCVEVVNDRFERERLSRR